MRSPTVTRYANSSGVHIAYQVVGQGPVDLIFVPGWVSHVEHHWEEPRLAYFLHRIANFARLIVLDKRGTGLSDRVTQQPDLEQRIDDVRAVQDAVGSERAVLFGYSEGGSMCQLFAATYPARVLALITYGCWAKRLRAPDYPWGPTLDERQRFYDFLEANWGGVVDLGDLAPSVANDPEFCEWFAAYLRRSASPGAALALAQMNAHIDLRPVLPSIRVPTLIIHRTQDRDAPIEGGRYLAANIPGAIFVELPGADHLPWVGDANAVLQAVERFLVGLQLLPPPPRSLAAVVAVCRRAELSAGRDDNAWSRWQQAAMRLLTQQGGEVLQSRPRAELLATYAGAIRAIRFAQCLQGLLREHGCEGGIGVHLGEHRQEGEGWRGPAADRACQIAAWARSGEVAVSREVKDVAAGSGITFVDFTAGSGRSIEALELFVVEPREPQPSVGGPGDASSDHSEHTLTRQQRRILQLVAQGMSNRDIAHLMSRSEHTVHRHMANIFNRLGVETRAAAVAKATFDTANMARTGDGPVGR